MSKESLVEIGTMLYHPHRGTAGWVVEKRKVKDIDGSYTYYVVEWANNPVYDAVSKTNLLFYHQKYLDLQNGK